jgi:U3 small nucleolar RNA-associated protein 19
MTVQKASTPAPSAAETAKKITSLLKELPEERADATRLDDLRRVFSRLVASGDLKFGVTAIENPVAAKWQAFLIKNHKKMVAQLCRRIEAGKRSAIRCMWGVMAASPIVSVNVSYKYIHPDLLRKWMKAMVSQPIEDMDKSMRHMVESEFLDPYRDVQYYALGAIAVLATQEYDKQQKEETTSAAVADKLLQLLMMIQVPTSRDDIGDDQFLFPPPKDAVPDATSANDPEEGDESSEEESDEDGSDSEEDSDEDEKHTKVVSNRPVKRQKTEERKFAFQQLRAFRREYQKAWLAVLKLDLPVLSLKRALQFLPTRVFPNVAFPLRFSDFFMQAYTDHGNGILGVLALDGLFLLITQYELEYADFYKQLYRLITPRVLYVKYRARFFSLLTKCLTRNEMLPGHLVAAFSKRLCRCALSAPPSGTLFVLALVSNLLRKHPECASLIHRKGDSEMDDQFVATENDPVQTRALQSSLWELAVLERHYHPAVMTLAKSIGHDAEFKAPMHNMDDFSSHTYKSLFDQERKKKTKTAVTFKEPKSLFSNEDVFAGILQAGN